MKVVWTEQSLERLFQIEEYIGRQAPETAAVFVTHLIERAERLSQFPRAGRKVPEFDAEHLREIIEKNYRIVYRVTARRIEILTVFEAHHLLPISDLTY